jgi:N-acetyl-gamma-glutamyl-phosphate reductase
LHKVGIIGDGYTAAELLRLIVGHNHLEVVYISSTDNIGSCITEVYPQLKGLTDLVCEPTDLEQIKSRCEIVFLALPHGLSVPMVTELSLAGIKCIDLGADFRLKDAGLYKQYYELEHKAPHLLTEAVYGLPELYREQIKKAQIIANPGCFPTSAILPLVPLLAAGLIETQGIIIDSKSGVSGAGRGLKLGSQYCEVNEGIHAYGVGTHRHTPEIAQEMSFAAGSPVDIIFSPHLVPMNRGILTTSYSRLRPGIAPNKVRQVLEERYAEEYFIRVLPEGQMPHTKWVYGSNFVDIGIFVDERRGYVVLVSAIDNLTKGASGQAIQNLNIMLGLAENEGLRFTGVMP